jgi:hypothetical protein
VFGWCMRALHILIGYHTSLLSAIMVMALFLWRRVGTIISVAIICCYSVLSYGVFGWCMRALHILIGYHTSLSYAKTVMALFLLWSVGPMMLVAIICCYNVMSFGVFGWCMRALRILIGYHTSLLSAITVMVLLSRRVRMTISVAIVFGWCMTALRVVIGYHTSFLSAMMVMTLFLSWRVRPMMSVAIVHCYNVLSFRVFGWCMRALHILIGYHPSLLSAKTVMALFSWRRVGTIILVAIVRCYTVLSYGVFGWCMRALHILIGYHPSLLCAKTVMALFSWRRVGTIISVAIVRCYTVLSYGVFGWYMRALHILFGYHTSLLSSAMMFFCYGGSVQ